jgi:HEAT repeat protein
MGKTSLVAHFVSTFGGALPILFLEGRRLSFADEQTLVRAVIGELQGVLSPEHRVQEEAALVHLLAEEHRLTVVVDAIDEARAPARKVAQAIEFWLESRLGRASVLIVTSRPDFWRLLGPERWHHSRAHGPQVETNEWREFGDDRPSRADDSFPRRFTAIELGEAWQRAGRHLPELYALPAHVREALTHPFTLRAYLKLIASVPRPELGTQAGIVSAWINERLDAEADVSLRLTARELALALDWTARTLDERSARWLAIHDFVGAPRFNPHEPPGPVIDRLLSASLLEAHPDDAGLIGFVEEAVFDHFLASADAEDVARDLAGTIETLKALPFTRARHRVERLSAIGVAVREEFVRELSKADPTLAAGAVGVDPQHISPALRSTVADAIGSMLSARLRVDAAFALELLGRMRCPEAERALLNWLGSTSERTPVLRAYAAIACLLLDSVAGAEVVHAYPWLVRGGKTVYFVDLFAMVRRASEPLRRAVGDLALADMVSPDELTRIRALNLIGYLGDVRALPLLEERLERQGVLEANENHALFAIGDPALPLLDRSARRTAVRMKPLRTGTTEWAHLYEKIVLVSGGLSYLATPATEELVRTWLASEDDELRGMAHRLAEILRSVSLVFEAVRRDPAWNHLPYQESYTWVDPHSWLECWRATEDTNVRAAWLRFFTAAPTVEIEQILIECLAVPRLSARAARHLGRMASQRARKPLRELLRSSTDAWPRWEAIKALGRLHDAESANALVQVVAGHQDDLHVRREAALSLGLVQTDETEVALVALLADAHTQDVAAAGLLRHGSPSAVSRMLALARDRGAEWLVARSHDAYSYDGRWRRQYVTHVAADELVGFLSEHEDEFRGGKKWDLIQALEALDGTAVREYFRRLVLRRGTDGDVLLRNDSKLLASDVALRELSDRGDDFVVGHFVAEALGEDGRAWFVGRELGQFPGAAVRRELAAVLSAGENSPTRLARAMRLLGAYGAAEDAGLLKKFLSDSTLEVAEAAREAILSLEDPLRIPEGWTLLG